MNIKRISVWGISICSLYGALAAVLPVPVPLGGSPVPRKVRRAISDSLSQFDQTTLFAQIFFITIALVVLTGFCYGVWRLYVRRRKVAFLRPLYHARLESMQGNVAKVSISLMQRLIRGRFFRFKLGKRLVDDVADMVTRLSDASYSDAQKHAIVSYIREVMSLL